VGSIKGECSSRIFFVGGRGRAIRRLEFSGLRIVATSDGYDSTSKARKVHRGFEGLMNEIFLDDLRERVHRGLAGQAMKRY
jgi:hypothetical protein